MKNEMKKTRSTLKVSTMTLLSLKQRLYLMRLCILMVVTFKQA